eukprot:5312660-Amphidinium_carterae.1
MKAGNHTFPITHKPLRHAFLKRPDSGQVLRSIGGLLEPRKRQPDTFTRVSVVANTAPPKGRISTVSARPIGPHSVHSLETKAGS